MSEIRVPEGMLKAAIEMMRKWNGYPHPDSEENAALVRSTTRLLEAALQWLSEHPIVPTDEQANALWKIALNLIPEENETGHAAKNVVMEWQRRMFLAREPELPEEVNDLLWDRGKEREIVGLDEHNNDVIEAFRRGQKSKTCPVK